MVAALGNPFDDLRFAIVLDAPENPEPYLIDRFRFGGAGPAYEKVDIRMPFPANVKPERYLFLARERLSVGDDVQVQSLLAGRMVAASLGTQGIELGARVELDSLMSYGPVALGDRTRIRGWVAGVSQVAAGQDAEVIGGLSTSLPSLQEQRWTAVFEPSADDVVVPAGTTLALAPGRYRNVSIEGGTLSLRAGTYRIDRLNLSFEGSILLESGAAITTIVRTGMELRGQMRSTRDSVPPEAEWIYAGAGPLAISADTIGRVVAPNADVTVHWPTLNSTTPAPGALRSPATIDAIWGGTIVVPSFPRVPDITPQVPPVAWFPRPKFTPKHGTPDLTVPEPDSTDRAGTSAAAAVYTEWDNPPFHGTFDWNGEESGSGLGPYFFDGEWSGLGDAHVAVRHLLPSSGATDLGWSAALLPGFVEELGSERIFPFSQSSAADPVARFHTRATNIWHGAIFQATRTLVHDDGDTRLGTHQSLYVTLDPRTHLVPVVVIGWDNSEQVSGLVAQFDFLPTEPFSALSTTIDQEPSPMGPFLDPRAPGAQTPPDELWHQCNIQFQVVKAFHLGAPEPVGTPFGTNRCSTDPTKRDYVSDEELVARIRERVSEEEFQQLFGPGGLKPIVLQYGAVPGFPSGCAGYRGKADVVGLVAAGASSTGMIQMPESDTRNTAHEIGHILIGTGHATDTTLLMSDSAQGQRISVAQCDIAREKARPLTDRYRIFNEWRGLAEAPPPAPPETPAVFAPPPAEAISSSFEPICCVEETGRKQRVSPLGCLTFVRGKVSATCDVCCGSELNTVGLDECEAEDVVPESLCDVICCEVDGVREVGVKRGDCDSRGGGECIDVP